jgi:hypothetical protein
LLWLLVVLRILTTTALIRIKFHTRMNATYG